MTALLFDAGCSSTRAGYNSAPYTAVSREGAFEVRDYPVLRVVQTPLKEEGGDGGFGRLFGFISGGNDKSQKIAMTTPVFMSGDEKERTMAFVLPESLDASLMPQPADKAVSLREIPEGRFAVLRFSGGRSALREQEALGQLRAWMGTQGLNTTASPVFGYFDPPWTPPFLRRNEVMLRFTTEPAVSKD